MKERLTRFDLNDAFKALSDIEMPIASKRPSKAESLHEALKKSDKFEALFEDYYDVQNSTELDTAKDEREEEIAKAKLARIEKIVDLDAESPEDLLPSYAGKIIIQCPQCMTMFYKDENDLVPAENDESLVNVDEVCQHCGNKSGYTVIGKVAPIEKEEEANFEQAEASDENAETTEETSTDDQSTETPEENSDLSLDFDTAEEDSTDAESTTETEDPETTEEAEDLDLADSEDTSEEEEEKNESLNTPLNKSVTMKLTESADSVVNDLKTIYADYKKLLTDFYTKKRTDGSEAAGKIADEIAEKYPYYVNYFTQDKITGANHYALFMGSEQECEAWVKENGYLFDHIGFDAKTGKSAFKKTAGNSAELKVRKQELEALGGQNNMPIREDSVYSGIGLLKKFAEGEKEDAETNAKEKAEHIKDKKFLFRKTGKQTYGNKKLDRAVRAKLEEYNNAEINSTIDVSELADLHKKWTEDIAQRVFMGELSTNGLVYRKDFNIPTRVYGVIKLSDKKVDMSKLTLAEATDNSEGEELRSEVSVEGTLVEDIDTAEVNKALDKHNQFISFIQSQIKMHEEALKKAGDNEEVKAAIQKMIDGLQDDLKNALPEAIKDTVETVDNSDALPTPEETSEEVKEEETKTEALHEDVNTEEPSATEVAKLLDSEEFSTPVSDAEVQASLDILDGEEEFTMESLEEINDDEVEFEITESLKEVYSNVENFTLSNCKIVDNKFIIEGIITFESGKSKSTTYVFESIHKNKCHAVKLVGTNTDLCESGKFIFNGYLQDDGKYLVVESLAYKYSINKNLVEGLVKRK